MSDGSLTPNEEFWVVLQPKLLRRGYALRPRYSPDWTPSWLQSGSVAKWFDCVDSLIPVKRDVLDAIRIVDGLKVVIKRVSSQGNEYKIALHLSSSAMLSNPRNRAVPVLDVIELHDGNALLVMPYLRQFDTPWFHCLGEVVDAFRQFLQGLQFMHEQNIAHRDIGLLNLMMDESQLIPKGSHFCRPFTHDGRTSIATWRQRCTLTQVQYYYIDFGLSTWFPNGSAYAAVLGRCGQVKTVPELSDTVPYDPFKADIYQLGHTLQEFIKPYPALVTFAPLCQKMMSHNPRDRPTISECLTIFKASISKMDLNARIRHDIDGHSIWHNGDTTFERICQSTFNIRAFQPLGVAVTLFSSGLLTYVIGRFFLL